MEKLLVQAISEVKTSLMVKGLGTERAEKRARDTLSLALKNARETAALGLETERRLRTKFSPEKIGFFFETLTVSKETSAALAAEIEKELRR